MFPGGYRADRNIEDATTDFYLGMADDYVGSPMLSALYPTWATRRGNRALAANS